MHAVYVYIYIYIYIYTYRWIDKKCAFWFQVDLSQMAILAKVIGVSIYTIHGQLSKHPACLVDAIGVTFPSVVLLRMKINSITKQQLPYSHAGYNECDWQQLLGFIVEVTVGEGLRGPVPQPSFETFGPPWSFFPECPVEALTSRAPSVFTLS